MLKKDTTLTLYGYMSKEFQSCVCQYWCLIGYGNDNLNFPYNLVVEHPIKSSQRFTN